MADPTIQDYFGAQAQLIDSTATFTPAPGKKYLVIEADSIGLTLLDRVDPDKLLAQVIFTAATWAAGETFNENGVELTLPAKQGFSTRKTLPAIAWGFSGTIYTTDNSSTAFPVAEII